MIQTEEKLGMLFLKTYQEYKRQSKYDFAEPLPLAAIHGLEVAK